MLDGQGIFELNKNIVVRGISEKFWAFDTNSGKQYRLNELSYDILSVLDGRKNVDAIVGEQIKHYDVEKEVLLFDVLSFLEKALEKNMVKTC